MRILVATCIALLVVSASAETTVSSVADLITAMQSCEDGSTFKLSSDVDFQPYTDGNVVVPPEKSLILDLNGKKLTVPFNVQGKLKVIDTSSEKCGFINNQIYFEDNGQIEFDLHNVALISTPVEFNNVANLNSLGADINMKLGCNIESSVSFWGILMSVPANADVTLDMNRHYFTGYSIEVYGKLRIVNNLITTKTDAFDCGLVVYDGAKLDYNGVRIIPVYSYSHLIVDGQDDDAFENIIELLKAGAVIRAELIADVCDSFEVPRGTSLTVDLSGHTLDGEIEVNGKLKVINSFDEEGGLKAKISVGASGEYESTIPKTVSTFAELTSALGSSAGSTLNLKLGSDITGDVVEIPVGANITLDLSGRVLTCDKMKVLGGLTLVDSAGKSGYIMADETYIGRKGFVKIAYGPLRTTLTYLSQGLMLMFK